jgi:hypothetical protein
MYLPYMNVIMPAFISIRIQSPILPVMTQLILLGFVSSHNGAILQLVRLEYQSLLYNNAFTALLKQQCTGDLSKVLRSNHM